MPDLTPEEIPQAQKIAYLKSLARGNGKDPPLYDPRAAIGDFWQAAGEVIAHRGSTRNVQTMHVIDWLKSDALTLPKRWDGGDFISYFKQVVAAFKAENAKLATADYISSAVHSCVPIMDQVADKVLGMLEFYFAGYPHLAYAELDKCITFLGPHNFAPLYSRHDLSPDLSYLYRVRTGKPVRFTKGDLFHIPFQLRHKVGPQRYSVPGLPCLYLGGSIYVCWEEMQKPDISSLHISRFSAVGEPLKILNFGIRPALMARLVEKNLANLQGNQPLKQFITAYCVCWPLLAACSIRVKYRDEPFKPEYVIPHLVLQWITNTRNLDGVYYFSVNIDNYYDDQMAAANFVFPAQTVARPSGYCTKLLDAFHLSEPVPWQLATGIQVAGYPPNCNWKIELIPGVYADYVKTEFGMMQAKLMSLPIGPV